jgi:hypothetical protein
MKKRPPTEAAPSNLAVQWRLFCYALDSINTELSIFVANLPSILVSGRIVGLHRLVHIIENVYDDTIFGRGSLDRHTAANNIAIQSPRRVLAAATIRFSFLIPNDRN